MIVRLLAIISGLLGSLSAYAMVIDNPSLAGQCDANPVVVPTNTTLYEKYVCRGQTDGFRLIVPGSCTKYYECLNATATVNTCDCNTPFYDPICRICVAQSNCREEDIVVPGGPKDCTGVCCGKAIGLYPNPTNRTQFYFCNQNAGILHSCCELQEFNPITKACDVPAKCP